MSNREQLVDAVEKLTLLINTKEETLSLKETILRSLLTLLSLTREESERQEIRERFFLTFKEIVKLMSELDQNRSFLEEMTFKASMA